MSPKRNLIAVRKGQVYRYVPKKGVTPKLLKIVGIRKGQQPKATYRHITKTGRQSPRKHKWEPATITAWLSWNGTQWVFPFGQLVS